jgi:phosphoribosylglycinamide formyltransferase-1
VPVRGDDTAETLAARVLRQEHRIYPQAVRWVAEGRLSISGGRVNLKDDSASQSVLSDGQ